MKPVHRWVKNKENNKIFMYIPEIQNRKILFEEEAHTFRIYSHQSVERYFHEILFKSVFQDQKLVILIAENKNISFRIIKKFEHYRK